MSDSTAHHDARSRKKFGDYSSGDQITDRYALVRPLGSGGMGVVWVGYSVALDINVAIKLLHGSLSGTEAVERMQREARAAARLGHSALARVLDFGHTRRGHPFLVMELLHGESLDETIARKRQLEPVRAVRTLLPIAHALAVAHDKGIIHRDIKPANVFISRDDAERTQPKLLDFGVAKLDELQDAEARKLTNKGTLLGSPSYMSPEQALGYEDLDSRSDIWSFCVTLYESVVGRLPFDGPNYNALIRAIAYDDPQPITERGVDDPELWAILAKGMQRAREDRYETMWEVGRALAKYLIARGVEEDIAAVSLEATWLSEPSRGKHPSTLPPPLLSAAEEPRKGMAQMTTHVRSRWPRSVSRTARVGFALGVLIALGVAFAIGQADKGPEVPPARADGAPRAPQKNVAHTPGEIVEDVAEPVDSQTLDSLPEAPATPSDTADDPAPDTKGSSTSKPKPMRQKPSPKKRPTVDRDFGF